MWGKLLRGIGCLSYVGLLLGVVGLVSYATFSLFVRGGVTPTPELAGLAEDAARALLADQGLQLLRDEEDRFDDQVPPGHVVLQRPRAGTLVKRGSEVRVVFSRGPRRIEVPSVIGQAVQAAQVQLVAAELSLGRTLEVFSDAPRGTVVAQHPPGGERTEHRASVDLFVAIGGPSETYLMPDLVRRRFEEVKRFFDDRGFRLGRVSYESYEGLEPGTVVQQYPLAGHALRQGDVISLGVVAGEEASPPLTPAPG